MEKYAYEKEMEYLRQFNVGTYQNEIQYAGVINEYNNILVEGLYNELSNKFLDEQREYLKVVHNIKINESPVVDHYIQKEFIQL